MGKNYSKSKDDFKDKNNILGLLEKILDLLANQKFGVEEEIKDEIKDIEKEIKEILRKLDHKKPGY